MAWASYEGSHMVVWIRVKADPHDKARGFSIINREMRVLGYEPVEDEMVDFWGNKMVGRFWRVAEAEMLRVIPELRRFSQGKYWLFPFEFCESFVRPHDYLTYEVREIFLWDEEDIKDTADPKEKPS